MKSEILSRLYVLSEEEQFLLIRDDENPYKSIYTKSNRFLIERRHISTIVSGIPTSSICVRAHPRFKHFPIHSHDFFELMYVCSGNISHVIGNKTVKLEEGEIIILGKATKHSILPTELNDIGVNIIVSVDFFEKLLVQLRDSTLLPDKFFARLFTNDEDQYCVFRTSKNILVNNIVENMLYSVFENTNSDMHIMQQSLGLLLSYLAAIPDSLTDASEGDDHTEQTKRKILNYIRTSYNTATLTEAAEMLGLSASYLSRWIKNNFGISFKSLLMNERFAVAELMIRTTKLSIGEIIINVGYENSSYFHKEFKKRYKTTPNNFRRI